MKCDLVGPSYVERFPTFDAQRTINFYPVVDETQKGKEIAALYGTPGLLSFTTCGSGPIRGNLAPANGRAFEVSGNQLYEIFADGTNISRGTMTSTNSICSLAENGLQLAVCDGTGLYILTYATNAFAKVTSSFPGGGTVTFIDGYFMVNVPSSGKFYKSALYDGLTWGALDFKTAESSPDNLARVFNAIGQLWALGDKTIEIFTNVGGSGFGFERIAGAKIETGCIAPHSVVSLDNSIFWLGADKDGFGIVYKASGFSPQRISTFGIEYLLRQVSDLTVLRAYTYQEDGHVFYALTGAGMNTTLVYDVSTQMWHERAYLNSMGNFEAHLGVCHMFAFGKHLVGSRVDGKVYDMSLNYYSDDGAALKSQRTFTHIYKDGNFFMPGNLEVDFESGVGLTTGQGSDPVCWLEVSNDFARTWGGEQTQPIGKIGEYRTRSIWRRLGGDYAFTFRLSITDPVRRAVVGAYFS